MDDGSSPGRRLAAVVLLGLLPWTVVVFEGEASLVFGFGLVNTNPPDLVNLYDYLFVYTGGLLVFAGISHAHVAYGLYRVYGMSPATVLPVGALTTWAVAWWFYWPLARERGPGPL